VIPEKNTARLAVPPAAAMAASLSRPRARSSRYLETRYHLAMADWLGGRVAEAERGLAEVVAERNAADERYLAVRACHDLGHVQQAQGRLGAALRTYQHGLEIAAEPAHLPLPAAGMAHVGLAEVLYERGELDAALRHATEGVALCRQLAYAPPLATGLVTPAWIRQAQGDHAGALDAVDQAEGATPGPGMVDLLNPVPAQRARLLLTQGNTAAAARWTGQRGLCADDQPDYPRERAWLLLARVLLGEQTPDLALRLLDRLHELAVSQERTGSLPEVQVLRALALAATGDENDALAALTEALTVGAPEGYLRVFVDEGPRWPPCSAGSPPPRPGHRPWPPRASREPTWAGCSRRSSGTALRSCPVPDLAAPWWRGWPRR
jgi:tetratricopeptide (TPR) repeat protein